MATEKRAIPLLGDVVDSLGFGFAQVRAGLVGGGVFLADGCEILIITSVSDAVGDHWGLCPFEKGLIVSMVFMGVFLGNLISGPIGDNWGRRHIIIASYVGLFVFGLVSSLSRNLSELCIARFCVGFFYGVGQPAWNALGAELTPSNKRELMMGLSLSLFEVGEMYSCLLLMADDPTLKSIHWRRLIQLAAIPAGVQAVLAFFFLHQSPSFLAINGRKEEAMAVLDSMRHDNGRSDQPIEFRVATSHSDFDARRRSSNRRLSWRSQRDAFFQLRVVFGSQYRVTSLITIFSCFVVNLTYFGTMYAFTQVFARHKFSNFSAATELLIGAGWELAGFTSAVLASFYVKRIRCISLYLLLMIMFLLMFTFGNEKGHSGFMQAGFYGIKWWTNIGMFYVFQYSVEVYPTVARTTGHAICMGFARLASIFAPMIYEVLYSKTGHTSTFFYLIVAVCAANLLLTPFLTIETMGMALRDDVDDETPAAAREAEALTMDDSSSKIAMMPEPFMNR
mmetsp:Transcript_56334/g.127315  ORF Transcript_56334/g.127315 Transcript_56334/m.127315 type:complete len:507 (-) Transcript_56334:180-1700(-)